MLSVVCLVKAMSHYLYCDAFREFLHFFEACHFGSMDVKVFKSPVVCEGFTDIKRHSSFTFLLQINLQEIIPDIKYLQYKNTHFSLYIQYKQFSCSVLDSALGL